jgi:hypothetical protein
MKTIKNYIGSTLSNGALIVDSKPLGGAYPNDYLIIAVRNTLPHPYIVWNMRDENGILTTYKGDYCESLDEAQARYKARQV